MRLPTALHKCSKCLLSVHTKKPQHLRSTNCQRPLHCTGRGTNGAQTQGYKHGEARSDAGESRRRWRVLRRRELHFTFSKFSVQSVASHGLTIFRILFTHCRVLAAQSRARRPPAPEPPSRLSKRSWLLVPAHAARDQVRPSRISHHLDRPLASRAGSGKSSCDCGDHSAALRMSLPTSTASAAGCRLAGLREGRTKRAAPGRSLGGQAAVGRGRRRRLASGCEL